MTAFKRRHELSRIIGDLSTAMGLLERDDPALDVAAKFVTKGLARLNALIAREAEPAPPEPEERK